MPYEKLDLPGNLAKGAQAGLLMDMRESERMKRQKEQKSDALLPELLQKYKSGDQGALLQIANVNPDMAKTIMDMEQNESQAEARKSSSAYQMGALNIEQAKLKIGQMRAKQEAVLAGYRGLQKALDGVESPSDKSKIMKLYTKGVERNGINGVMFNDPESQEAMGILKGEWNTGVQEFIDNNVKLMEGYQPQELMAVSQGATVIDKATGKPVFTAPTGAGRPAPESPAGKVAADVEAGLLPPSVLEATVADASLSEEGKTARSNAEGAIEFVAKLSDLERAVEELGVAGGPLQGMLLPRLAGQAISSLLEPGSPPDIAESKRQFFEQAQASAELDVAKMKMKGTGTITENEREIARKTLPGIKDVDQETSMKKLDNLVNEAARSIKKAEQFNLTIPAETVDFILKWKAKRAAMRKK